MSTKVAQVILSFVLCLMVLTLSVCTAAPMSDYMQDTDELANRETENLMLSPSYREEILRNIMSEQSSDNDSSPYKPDSIKRSGLRTMISAAKRMALARSSRGGVALCLWKVCPAGPWLSRQ